MSDNIVVLEIKFDGKIADRSQFLKSVRNDIMRLTKERMKLDALIYEIVKNIFDHAGGLGSLTLVKLANGSFEFKIYDNGPDSTLAGKGVNYGQGLSIIGITATSLGIDLKIDKSKGFSYSGIYIPGKPLNLE